MSVEYPDLTDYLVVAGALTGLDDQTLLTATKLDLADSTLHAPSAGFGEQDLYPDFVARATREKPSADRRQQTSCLGDAPTLH